MHLDLKNVQKLHKSEWISRKKLLQTLMLCRNRLLFMLLIIYSTLCISSGSAFHIPQHVTPVVHHAIKTSVFNGADQWVGDRLSTHPAYDFPATDTGIYHVSPLFQDYYQSHGGVNSLGAPLTVAFPTEHGWMQFFAWSALLLPASPSRTIPRTDNAAKTSLQGLLESGIYDSSSPIVRLSMLEALLAVGSLVPLGVGNPAFTYGDLRTATDPDTMVEAPEIEPISTPNYKKKQAVFLKEGTRDDKDIGFLIPQTIWAYINRPSISPDGWEKDFGDPLTRPLTFTTIQQGQLSRTEVQLFKREGVVVDDDALDASGRPRVTILPTGLAYLRTLGPPAVTPQAQQHVWVVDQAPLLRVPDSKQTIAHVGPNFPLFLQGNAHWNNGNLWYQIQWAVRPQKKSSGWVNAAALTFRSPGNVPGWASIDALSSDLAGYLGRSGDNVHVAVYDMTRQRYYTFHSDAHFITGSSMKVAIMLTFLDMLENQGKTPDAKEMDLLTKMIENSDNDAASELYFKKIGGAAGVADYLARIGISGLDPNPAAWGLSQITPMAMVNLLTDLYNGTILTAQDRELAFSLLESIESDQRFGVGDTAPDSANVALKNGWLPAPDGLWAVNSSGIVMNGNEVYIISVYTEEQPSFEDGQAVLDHVCGIISAQLN